MELGPRRMFHDGYVTADGGGPHKRSVIIVTDGAFVPPMVAELLS